MRWSLFCLLASVVLSSATQAQTPAGIPVFEITLAESKVKFYVVASVPIEGTFDKWDAALTFSSTDVTTAVLDVEIQADSVDTGSGLKDAKLKGIDFKSTKTIQTGPDAFEVYGNFTIRGVTKPEKLTASVSGKGTGSGTIHGTMAFDRKNYGMNSGIPFIRIANRVEVTVVFKVKRVSGPPLAFKQ
jgi:polyisoprenoid-binding protein YceI